jgi:heptosyltransferase-2
MVMAQSLFKAIKGNDPDAAIDVLAPAWSEPLLARMPEVREAIVMPLAHGQFAPRQRWRLGRSLRGRYAQSIVLPNSWKSAIVPFAAGVPRRTGWLGEARYGLLNDVRRLDRQRLPMTVQRFVALAGSAGESQAPQVLPPRFEVRAMDVQQAMQDLGIRKQARRPVLALCPGAEFGPAKRWPAESFAELARDMAGSGWDVWLFGSHKDRDVCAAVAGDAGEHCSDLSGRTSLAQAVDLLSLTDAVVSNDSGLMHVAAALDRPLVALYGSSDPGFTPPLNERHRIVSLGLDCSPCFKRDCPLGHTHCLTRMTVGQVCEALQDVAGTRTAFACH